MGLVSEAAEGRGKSRDFVTENAGQGEVLMLRQGGLENVVRIYRR